MGTRCSCIQKAAFTSTDYFRKLFDLVHELSNAVSMHTTYEDIFIIQNRFRDALGVAYMDTVAVLAKAMKMFRKRSKIIRVQERREVISSHSQKKK